MTDIAALQSMARTVRMDIVKMIHAAGSGHPGGCLSATDLLVALYFEVLNLDPTQPRWEGRDRFILSKGHCCPAQYACLARRGYFDPEILLTLRKYGSILQGHPDRNKCPGIDMTSGSLGNGLGCGVGLALAARKKGQSHQVFVMLGDGECQEGVVWEGAMCAAHHQLNNLIAIVDVNKLQIIGETSRIMNVEPLADKWQAFGWQVLRCDGHDMLSIVPTLYEAKGRAAQGPVVILADTVKGKGVSFMENVAKWHGAAPSSQELAQALAELAGPERTAEMKGGDCHD